jgi:exosortase D (VPLPA-CTERM-specific)
VTAQSQWTRAPAGVRDISPAGLFWLAVALVAAVPTFRYGLEQLAGEWSRPEYSHGPVIPVLSFYMFLRELKTVPPAPVPDAERWPGVAVLAAGLALGLLGSLVHLSDLAFYALIVWTFGLVLTGFGWRRGRIFWPSVLHLVFMLPLPQFLYWKLSATLQLISSGIGVWLVGRAGIPVLLEGNIIDLGVYKLQVAEACSGLRYLFPIMSFTYVFAVLYRGPLWHKLVLLLAAVPLAVLMNALRIGIIGILVDRFGIAQAEGFLHVFEGWVIFLGCIGLLFALARAMQRLSGDRRPLGEALELNFAGLGAQAARVLSVTPSRPLIAAALVTTALAAAGSLAPAGGGTPPPRETFELYPREADGWSGVTGRLSPEIEGRLRADDYLAAIYRHPGEAAPVDFFLSYYGRQTEGSRVHSPEVCLPGTGWEVSAIRRIGIDLPGTGFPPFEVNRALVQKEFDRQLVYYWFEGRGRRTTSDFLAKLGFMTDAVRLGRTDGGLVRVATPVVEGGEAAADARLRRFLAAAVPPLRRFIPQ